MLSFGVLSKRSGKPRRLVLRAAAKVNLALEVLGRRDDGYHETATVMQAVDLSDRLVLEDADVLELRTTALDVPTDGTNLALKAAATLREMAGSSRGTRITLEKRIPVAAGLGGGSTDAAAVLVGLSRLWGLRWPRDRLAEVGGTLGVDGPVFLHGGAPRGAGRGGRGEALPSCGRGLVLGETRGVARSYDHARQIRARVSRARWRCWAVRALRGPAIRMR